MVILCEAGMGLATYLLVALHGTIHPLISIILGLVDIKIIFKSTESVVILILPTALDQGGCISSKILSGL